MYYKEGTCMGKNSTEYMLKFGKIFQEQVLPVLKEMEPERRAAHEKAKDNALLAAVISYAFCFCFFCGPSFFWLPNSFMFAGTIGLIFSIIVVIFLTIILSKALSNLIKIQFDLRRNTLEDALKEKVMNVLLSAFGDFKTVTKDMVDQRVLETSKIFPYFDNIFCDDVIKGTYKNTEICMAEVSLLIDDAMSDNRTNNEIEESCKRFKLSKHAYIKTMVAKYGFNRVVIYARIPKNFKGHTIVMPKNVMPYCRYPKVELEDVDFSKQFDVYSTDQVEARYLLTTAFMERYKNVREAFSGSSISCSFVNNTFLIAISTKEDLFSLGRLDIPLTELSQYNTILNDFISVFELCEELKLYQNTGL